MKETGIKKKVCFEPKMIKKRKKKNSINPLKKKNLGMRSCSFSRN